MCGNAVIIKRLSAPRLNFGAAHTGPQDDTAHPSDDKDATPPQPTQALGAGPQPPHEVMQAWMAMAKRVLANTADVGDRFAEEARKIHYGETEERGIRGRATRDETEALLDEGIAVMPFPLPEALKGPLQ